MRKRTLLTLGLTMAAAASAHAATFTHAPLLPALGVDALDRSVARAQLGRDVFSQPYATVLITDTDIYDVFPYVETRRFQIASDPQWNRLVCSEPGQTLSAFDGSGTTAGALSEPRGMAVDENDRVYVADRGNDRIVVLQAVPEYGHLTLKPLYVIGGLHAPYDVAVSDNGTPFHPEDDLLYVADTGRNQVAAFALGAAGARPLGAIGGLGNGDGAFAGPMAITVGRANGANTNTVYVADAHNRRIVRLQMQGGSLRWAGAAPSGADAVTSLSTDAWGNVYAAAPQQGVLAKFNAALEPVAQMSSGLEHPRNVHVAFASVHDHRDGTQARTAEAGALTMEDWDGANGMRLWNLGAGVANLAVDATAAPVASFLLTDRAAVTLTVRDAASGRTLTTRDLGVLDAGARTIALNADDLSGFQGRSDLVLGVNARSAYHNGADDVAQAAFRATGSGVSATRAQLLGNSPNPAKPVTRISFVLPANLRSRPELALYDTNGRRVRTFAPLATAGLQDVAWDGTDDRGHDVKAGVYFYRLDAGATHETRRVAVVR